MTNSSRSSYSALPKFSRQYRVAIYGSCASLLRQVEADKDICHSSDPQLRTTPSWKLFVTSSHSQTGQNVPFLYAFRTLTASKKHMQLENRGTSLHYIYSIPSCLDFLLFFHCTIRIPSDIHWKPARQDCSAA